MRSLCILLTLFSATLAGQGGPSILGYGYNRANPINAAPGQMLTLIIGPVDDLLSKTVRAPANMDLPTELAGISVEYWQAVIGGGNPARLVPILEVLPFSPCDRVLLYQCREFAAVTVQVPLEAKSVLPLDRGSPIASIGIMRIVSDSESGDLGQVTVEPLADQVHVLTSCDSFVSGDNRAPLPGTLCHSIVAHADGTLVSANNPAKAGEEVVVYAVGLGQTSPASVTGQRARKSAPTQESFSLDFNFRSNAMASKPLPNAPRPIYSGSTEGFVGLYQVNLIIPPVPAATPPCVDGSTLPLPHNVVESNLTVSIGGTFTFDGAQLCVVP